MKGRGGCAVVVVLVVVVVVVGGGVCEHPSIYLAPYSVNSVERRKKQKVDAAAALDCIVAAEQSYSERFNKQTKYVYINIIV